MLLFTNRLRHTEQKLIARKLISPLILLSHRRDSATLSTLHREHREHRE